MDFKIKTKNKLDYFVKMVSILSLVTPIKMLRPKERLLLAYLLYYNDKYKSLDLEERSRIIFKNKEARIDISEALGMTSQTFYNNKSQLKVKNIINDEYLVKSFVHLYYKETFNLNFVLNGER